MKHVSRKTWILLAAVIAAGVAAIGGYAYWTSTGSGTGTAAVGLSNGTVTLHATVTGQLVPGGSASVAFTADNAGSSNLYVGTIHTTSITSDKPGCDMADFAMANVVSDTMVAAGANHQALNGTGSLTFANSGADQNECKGATLTLNLSS